MQLYTSERLDISQPVWHMNIIHIKISIWGGYLRKWSEFSDWYFGFIVIRGISQNYLRFNFLISCTKSVITNPYAEVFKGFRIYEFQIQIFMMDSDYILSYLL